MCEHSIYIRLRNSDKYVSNSIPDAQALGGHFDAFAPAVYGFLLHLVQCEECAHEALVDTFVSMPSAIEREHGLAAYVRHASAVCRSSVGDVENDAMKERIQAWYQEGRAKRFWDLGPRTDGQASPLRESVAIPHALHSDIP